MEKRGQSRRFKYQQVDNDATLDEDINIKEAEDTTEEDQMEFNEMPKVFIPSEDGSSKKNHSRSNVSSNGSGIKMILVCILCIVLGVGIYGGYKLLTGKNEEKISKVDKKKETDPEENTDSPVLSDQTAPEFIGFKERIVVNLNAVDVDYTKYFLAEDEGKSSEISVSGEVNLAAEGEYPITVTATDEAGNENTKDVIVQVVSDDTMVGVPLELSCMIDGSIPMAVDTKQRVDANVITYYYEEVSQELKDGIARLGLDVSGYHLDSYWHPSDIAGLYY